MARGAMKGEIPVKKRDKSGDEFMKSKKPDTKAFARWGDKAAARKEIGEKAREQRPKYGDEVKREPTHKRSDVHEKGMKPGERNEPGMKGRGGAKEERKGEHRERERHVERKAEKGGEKHVHIHHHIHHHGEKGEK